MCKTLNYYLIESINTLEKNILSVKLLTRFNYKELMLLRFDILNFGALNQKDFFMHVLLTTSSGKIELKI